MSIKALIPVRSGSKRVKNKNIRKFADSNLLSIKIKQMQRIYNKGLIDGIVVNSNDDEMLNLAKSLGVATIKRAEHFAHDLTPNEEFYEDMAKHMDCDNICLCHVTAPLLKDESIFKALELYKNLSSEFDSVISASALREFMYQDGKSLNYDENHKPRSQDLPLILALNYAVHIFAKDLMLKDKRIVGFKPYLFEIDKLEAMDIDEPLDFEVAEFLYKKYFLTRGGDC